MYFFNLKENYFFGLYILVMLSVRYQDLGPIQAPGPVPIVRRGDPRPIQALSLVPYWLWAQAQ